MERREVEPAELDLQSSGQRHYWVVLTGDAESVYRIPLSVFVGPQAAEGRGLVAFGAMHGDEYEGPLAIKHIMGQINPNDVRGRIVLVPVLNADDGLNLNRLFVPYDDTNPAPDTITHQIAAFVRARIWPHVHIVIDIHSGGDIIRTAHYVSFTPASDPLENAQRQEIARWSGAPFRIERGEPGAAPGLLIDDAGRLGKMTFGSELGWGGMADQNGVRYARQCVLAAAIRHNQLEGEIAPIDHHADGSQHLVASAAAMTAPFDGHFESLVTCGEPVSRGQTVGYMHDFERIDEPPLAVVSTADGFVPSQARGARVRRGDNLVGVSRVVE